MKSFKSFFTEAKAVTADALMNRWRKEVRVKDKLIEQYPKNRAAIETVWRSTWNKVFDTAYSKKAKAKLSSKELAAMDQLQQKWNAFVADLKAKTQSSSVTAAQKWAKEKDPCKRQFQAALFQRVSGGTEPDTPKEAEIWTLVSQYVSEPQNHGVVSKAYVELLKCKGSYSVLQPGVTQIYRGLRVPLKTALAMVNPGKLTNKKTALATKIGTKDMVGHVTQYSPRYPVESWSAKPTVAWKFATGKITMAAEPYNFQVSAVRTILKDLKRLLETRKKLSADPRKNKEKLKTSKEEIQSYVWYAKETIDTYLSSESFVPVVYQIEPDKNCVMNPLFTNKIAKVLSIDPEHEITRVGESRAASTVWIPSEILEGAYLVLEIQDLIRQVGVPTVKIKATIPVKLKRGNT
jgi:hypothetical protein